MCCHLNDTSTQNYFSHKVTAGPAFCKQQHGRWQVKASDKWDEIDGAIFVQHFRWERVWLFWENCILGGHMCKLLYFYHVKDFIKVCYLWHWWLLLDHCSSLQFLLIVVHWLLEQCLQFSVLLLRTFVNLLVVLTLMVSRRYSASFV